LNDGGVGEAAAERLGKQEDDNGVGDADAPLFSCRLDNAKVISTVLSCLSHGTRRAQHAQCEATPEGLVFIVTGRAKFTQVLQLSTLWLMRFTVICFSYTLI
jgi:hypothetical protein